MFVNLRIEINIVSLLWLLHSENVKFVSWYQSLAKSFHKPIQLFIYCITIQLNLLTKRNAWYIRSLMWFHSQNFHFVITCIAVFFRRYSSFQIYPGIRACFTRTKTHTNFID